MVVSGNILFFRWYFTWLIFEWYFPNPGIFVCYETNFSNYKIHHDSIIDQKMRLFISEEHKEALALRRYLCSKK